MKVSNVVFDKPVDGHARLKNTTLALRVFFTTENKSRREVHVRCQGRTQSRC